MRQVNNLKLIKLYFNEKIKIASKINKKQINQILNQVINTYNKAGNVYLMANGGPAGLIENVATDLRFHPFVEDDKSKSLKKIRKLKIISLVESPGALTGVSNDLGFENVFVEQLKNFVYAKKINQNDLLIAFSGSGNSKNILKAIKFAKKYSVFTICISGRSGGMAKNISNLCLLVPGKSKFPGQVGKNDNNFHIEDFQTSIMHIITGLFKKYINDKIKKRI
tara:strand:- start:281 stop:949 length:669 start_codon:yes stop_codon:yes gene_type:complete